MASIESRVRSLEETRNRRNRRTDWQSIPQPDGSIAIVAPNGYVLITWPTLSDEEWVAKYGRSGSLDTPKT